MTSERFIEFIFKIPQESKGAVISKLTDMGALGFIEQGDDTVTYFKASQDIRRIVDELHGFREVLKNSGLGPDFTFRHDLIADKDWNEVWKKSFEPIEAGDNLLIVPSWMEVETDRTVILIDPGRAFGTGHHETTRTCLGLVEKYARDNKGKKLLDIGTGSGVLAIGAIILGFGSAVGVDTDPPAVEASHHNIELNGVENIKIKLGEVSEVEGRFDLITANLISETLINIAGQIAERLTPGGIAILSGMLKGQEDGVIKAMEAAGLSHQVRIEDGKWVTLVLDRC